MKKVILYGPSMDNTPKEKIGGAEVGTKRTKELLTLNGFDVVMINKPNLFKKKLNFIIDYFKARNKIRKMLTSNDIFYCIGFYYNQSFIEKKFIRIAKKKGCTIIYEPKNGSLLKSFENCGKKYKKRMNYIFYNSKYVFCQGECYADYINKIFPGKGIYIPNYVKDETVIEKKVISNDISLIYFGRISKSKNIELIIDIFDILSKRSNRPTTLTLIGASDSNYHDSLVDKINSIEGKSFIKFYDRMSQEDIIKLMKQSNFFLFPSNEFHEGHSNSLTEAMSQGLIPIVSDSGFNKDIVNNDNLVCYDFDANLYANKILSLIDDYDLDKLSEEMIKRVKENYVASIIIERQLSILKKC